MKNLLEQYNTAEKEILARFGYTGGGMMIQDATGAQWLRRGDEIFRAPELTAQLVESEGNFWGSYIIQEWHTDTHLMIYRDTQTSSGYILEIYDKSKEITEPDSRLLYALEAW